MDAIIVLLTPLFNHDVCLPPISKDQRSRHSPRNAPLTLSMNGFSQGVHRPQRPAVSARTLCQPEHPQLPQPQPGDGRDGHEHVLQRLRLCAWQSVFTEQIPKRLFFTVLRKLYCLGSGLKAHCLTAIIFCIYPYGVASGVMSAISPSPKSDMSSPMSSIRR
jgi:hypothetical protein